MMLIIRLNKNQLASLIAGRGAQTTHPMTGAIQINLGHGLTTKDAIAELSIEDIVDALITTKPEAFIKAFTAHPDVCLCNDWPHKRGIGCL